MLFVMFIFRSEKSVDDGTDGDGGHQSTRARVASSNHGLSVKNDEEQFRTRMASLAFAKVVCCLMSSSLALGSGGCYGCNDLEFRSESHTLCSYHH